MYLWVLQESASIFNTPTSSGAWWPLIVVFKHMPSVWEWKDWCVDDMAQGGIGEVWAEVFKRHPKDKKNHTKTINMGEHKIQNM